MPKVCTSGAPDEFNDVAAYSTPTPAIISPIRFPGRRQNTYAPTATSDPT